MPLPNTAPDYLKELDEKYQQTTFANVGISTNSSNLVFANRPGQDQNDSTRLGNFDGFGALDVNFITAVVNAFPKLVGDLVNKVNGEALAADNAERQRLIDAQAGNTQSDTPLAAPSPETPNYDAPSDEASVPVDENGNAVANPLLEQPASEEQKTDNQ